MSLVDENVTFIRQTWPNGDHAPCKSEEFTGVVREKFVGLEKIAGRYYKVDFYLVELKDGVLGKFYCDEAVKINRDKALT